MSLKLENVSYIYEKGTTSETAAIKNVNLEIEKGEFIADNRAHRFWQININTAF